jgi:hypothetical protein
MKRRIPTSAELENEGALAPASDAPEDGPRPWGYCGSTELAGSECRLRWVRVSMSLTRRRANRRLVSQLPEQLSARMRKGQRRQTVGGSGETVTCAARDPNLLIGAGVRCPRARRPVRAVPLPGRRS